MRLLFYLSRFRRPAGSGPQLLTQDNLTAASSGATSSASFSIGSSSVWNSRTNQITAIYLGDSHDRSSIGNAVSLTATQNAGDFSLAPQLPEITLNSGSTGNLGLNLASLNNFNGDVTLTCTPSSSQISCSVSPSQLRADGAATATLTIACAANPASAQATATPAQRARTVESAAQALAAVSCSRPWSWLGSRITSVGWPCGSASACSPGC